MKSLRTTALLALVVVLLGGIFAHPVAAQDAPVTMMATPANDGYVKYGEWLPVWVELSNQGQDLDGMLSVQITGSTTTATYGLAVSLPSGARKRLPLYILPNNFSHELEVLFSAQDQVMARQKITVRPVANITYLVGLVAPEQGGLALLNGVKFPGQERSKTIVDVSLDDLPERGEGLSSFDLLVFDDVDTSRLTPGQQQALTDWVRQGGQLLIGGGTSAALTLAGLPAQILPASLDGQAELQAADLAGLAAFAQGSAVLTGGTFVYARPKPVGQAYILAGSDALPLVVESAFGKGLVDFVGLSLISAPFNSWPDTIPFYNRLLGSLGQFPDNQPVDISGRQMAGMNMIGNLTNIPALDLPSIQWLSILLGVYILLVGPANYLVLRKLRRMQLAWVTIPALTLVFSAGAFGLGFLMHGADVILNQIAIVRANGDGSAAITNYLGLYSPSQESYTLDVATPGLLSAIVGYDGNVWNSQGPMSNTSITFIQGERPKVKGLAIDQWSLQAFSEEERLEQFGQIRADLRLEGQTIVGTIANDTSAPLSDVFLIVDPFFVKLGDLAVGEEKPVSLDLGSSQPDRFGAPLSYRLYESEYMNGSAASRRIDIKRNILSTMLDGQNMKFAAISSTFPVGGIGSNLISNLSDFSATLIGWTEQVPPDVTVDGHAVQKQVMGLVVQKLPFQIGGGNEVEIPVGMISGRMSKAPASGGECGYPNGTGVFIDQGSAEFTFQTPELGNFQPVELRVSLTTDGSMSGHPLIELLDWEKNSWIPIDNAILGVNVITDPQRYIGLAGHIQIRLTNDAMQKGYCSFVDVGLKAGKGAQNGGQNGSH